MPTAIPWSENWGRTYRITIGVREHTLVEEGLEVLPPYIINEDTSISSSQCEFVPSNAIKLDNLTNPRGFTFEFESQQVASAKGAATETSSLTMHNLSKEQLDLLALPDCIVIVEAGYEGKLALCYTGDVVKVTPSNNPPDISYKIRLATVGNTARNLMINTVFDESMSTLDVLVKMVSRMPAATLATYGKLDIGTEYKTGGYTATGSFIEAFDNLMKKKNLEYAFSNNKVYVIPYRLKGEDYSDFARTNYTLSEASIKNISVVADLTKKSNTDTQNTVTKYNINTFYLPVEIGQLITVPTSDTLKEYAGTYIVKGRRVILQSKGNAWDVVLQVESIPRG